MEIETMKPAALHELRRWTSAEAMGDVTVHPDCTIRITSDGLDLSEEAVDGAEQSRAERSAPSASASSSALGLTADSTLGASSVHDQVDHQLPTTEEQVKAIAGRFPPEVVRMDVTGRPFTRMSQHRRSLIYPGAGTAAASATGAAGGTEEVRRRTRPRRQRSRRRNTIAGTDQKEIEEALGADRPGDVATAGALSTVDDIILSSSTALNAVHPKSAKEAHSDLRKWAFNSLKRWGRSRLRAISSINSSAASSNTVSGELHAADPVDDINVYETVSARRRGAGHIPLAPGLSGPVSLAVKLREGALGQRRFKAGDEPPHSSSGNWSASSESGRASVNSDSSHHPKSSTCSSVLPHRRRFINHSTSSSVTSEGTLTPEDMAAAPFLDDGETSSADYRGAGDALRWHGMMEFSISDVNLSTIRNEKVYSCDTEGYYTSFHMDSGLKTLKEEEVGAGLSLPATPMHSTSALSNCSSGRGSASLAQLTAESEYELFGRGSTSTTASSAGTVCTTLLADNSRGDNSLGSDRSLSKGPAVPERKSSLNVPCSSQECPPCSTVVALIHNTSQGHSPRSLSGDSPDSGHNTSSSPANSVSGPRDTDTDALVSPIPSLGSEMEFSECSDFEGTDRIERIRVKTTINTSRIPSMCAITPPQSDDETSLRQFTASNGDNSPKPASYVRAPAPLPQINRNDNHCYNEGNNNQMTDSNANKHLVDDNCNARPTTPVTNTSVTNIIHVDQKSGYATVETLDNAPKESNNNQKIRPPSPSGGTLTINSRIEEEESPSQPLHHLPLIKDALIPFSNMLSKFRKTPNAKSATNSCHSTPQSKCDISEKNDCVDESGEYVTITDMRNNNKPSSVPQCPPQRSETTEPVCEPSVNKNWENQEYVSLNEIPAPNSSEHQTSAVLSGSSSESSLERKRRQGARVTLDSEGKVVYSSDSLRRRKGAHTTFAPGQYVKDTSVSPSPSPVARHRIPKSIIRPVQSQASGLPHGPASKTPSSFASKPLISENLRSLENVPRPLDLQTKLNASIEKNRASMLQTSDLSGQRNNRVIIRAGLVSPTKDLSNCSVRSMSPRNTTPTRGAYVHVQPDNRPSIKTNPMFLQTDFDGPDDVNQPREPQQPHNNSEDCSSQFQNRKSPVKTPDQAEDQYAVLSPKEPFYQNLKLGKEGPTTVYQQYETRYATSPVSRNRFIASEMHNSGPSIEAPLHSSTPTKPDSTNASPLTNNTFSPIERHVSYARNESMQGSTIALANRTFRENEEKKPCLVLSPKSTMTSEELYAKIHKSKKQMNIKYEPEIVLSPSPSLGSQSPVGSDRSVSPAAAVNDPRLAARSRHSWSPNSSKYLDIASNYDPRSNTPSPNLRVPKDHGLTQVTSTYDFKRLLLQHGAGSGKSKMSAVERLKQAKQAATNAITSNAPKFRFGSTNTKPVSNNTAPLQSATSKVIPSKPTLLKPGPKSSLRFAAHRNDVRATPIIEDQHGEERATEVLQIQQLSASPMAGRMFHRLARTHNPVQCPPCPIYSEPEEPGQSHSALPKLEPNQYSTVQRKETQTTNPALAIPQPIKVTQYSKQLKFDQKQVLPTTLEEPDYCKLRNESPTALETAL